MYRYILLLFLICGQSIAQENKATLVVSSDHFIATDTLELHIYPDLLGGKYIAQPTVLRAIPENGKAEFFIDSDVSVVATLIFSYQKFNGFWKHGIFPL